MAGSFDLSTAPFAEGLFLGDYQALTSAGSTFEPFYVTTNASSPTNLTDVFATLSTESSSIPSAAESANRAPIKGGSAAAPTPEFQQRLSDAAQRTLRRRWVGHVEPAVGVRPAHSP